MERTELRLGTSGSVFDSGYGEVEIKAIKYWPSDSNNVIEASDIDVEKAFLQFSFDDWSAKLGRYTIGWGELEGGALDVINPSGGLTDSSMISQWILSSTRYFEDSDISFFYNTNNVCYNSFGDLPKPIKVAHAESNNYGELLMKSFGSTSDAEKKEAEYLQRYFYEFFVIQIGPAPFRGTGASIKKKATNTSADGMAYRIFACGIFNADDVTDSNNSKKRVIVPLESIVVLPK